MKKILVFSTFVLICITDGFCQTKIDTIAIKGLLLTRLAKSDYIQYENYQVLSKNSNHIILPIDITFRYVFIPENVLENYGNNISKSLYAFLNDTCLKEIFLFKPIIQIWNIRKIWMSSNIVTCDLQSTDSLQYKLRNNKAFLWRVQNINGIWLRIRSPIELVNDLVGNLSLIKRNIKKTVCSDVINTYFLIDFVALEFDQKEYTGIKRIKLH